MQTIGIDMAKDTFYAAFDDRKVLKFENTPAGIEEFMTTLEDGDFPITDTRIGVEATGVYHLLVGNADAQDLLVLTDTLSTADPTAYQEEQAEFGVTRSRNLFGGAYSMVAVRVPRGRGNPNRRAGHDEAHTERHDPWTRRATVAKTVAASVLGVPKLAVCSPLRIDLVRQQTEP
jgi:hypothetical protein